MPLADMLSEGPNERVRFPRAACAVVEGLEHRALEKRGLAACLWRPNDFLAVNGRRNSGFELSGLNQPLIELLFFGFCRNMVVSIHHR